MQQAASKATAAQQAPTPAPPTTSREMSAMVFQTQQLKDQLAELTARRGELVQQRLLMKSTERAGHDARIAEIDARSAALEKQLFATQDAIARAGDVRVIQGVGRGPVIIGGGTVQDPRGLTRGDVQRAVGSSVFGTTFTVFAFYMIYRGIRRIAGRRKPASAFPDNSAQLAQLQQSIDVIALEVERISEGQRYVAKVLGDKAALGPGEPVGARERR